MRILCVDPGPENCGVVVLESPVPGFVPNVRLPDDAMPLGHVIAIATPPNPFDDLVIEGIQNQGRVVGKTTFETCEAIGRIRERFGYDSSVKIYKSEVQLTLCGTTHATDSSIKRVIKDAYPSYGGGKTPSVGTKKQPGPLYGVKSHAWSALAVGLTHLIMSGRLTEWHRKTSE